MRYEVRLINLEEWLPENRLVYHPCNSYEEAKQKYLEWLDIYNDSEHIVELCEVQYYNYCESVRVMASSDNMNPYHVILEEEFINVHDDAEDEDQEEDDSDYYNEEVEL